MYISGNDSASTCGVSLHFWAINHSSETIDLIGVIAKQLGPSRRAVGGRVRTYLLRCDAQGHAAPCVPRTRTVNKYILITHAEIACI